MTPKFPCDEFVSIKFDELVYNGTQGASIEVYNLFGQLLLSKIVEPGGSVSINNISGNILIQLQSNSCYFVQKAHIP